MADAGPAEFGPLVNVDQSQPPFGHSRRLITDCDVQNNPGRAHTIVVRKGMWDEVWRYLYPHPVDQTGDPVPLDPDYEVEKSYR